MKTYTAARDFSLKAMPMLLLLVLVWPTIASTTQLSVVDSCGQEVAVLKLSIRKLENKLWMGSWQIEHLQMHKYLKPSQPAVSNSKLETDTAPGVNHNSSGTLGSSDLTLMKTLPPAGNLIVHDKDCSELFDRLRPPSGFYRIRPKSHQEPFLVYCDMEDGGGWTVFQRRRHGKVDFNRDWVDYRDGFGDFKLWNDEFWLGNEQMYSLLSEGKNLVKIDLMDWDGQRSYAFYENFRISDEADKYRLQYQLYSGRAGDALTGGGGMVEHWSTCLSGMQFSTRDQDNDRYLQGSCAQENKAGWWFNRCHAANLNGKFYRTGTYKGQYDNGVVWGTWKGLWYSLRHTTMKVRPLVFLDFAGSGAGEI
ncbi:fibrinogen like 1B [Micropterus dolomieu]|uniref:fibrinogen like 1B n=1 Tax=Micropterus dolomieu TaxID=147949 RepID=UPI001E8D24BA|nr:fibrinogen like 1B [Micropterus dolomieu]XP_045895248.1 fibrinogen like 1B [Micropterus dolomieu]XP_045895249.1 fibrinogen like 1B [Micropterus dolomieu]XP_045895250.1 fibrinogen like 1B [Micropterus dolomieu]